MSQYQYPGYDNRFAGSISDIMLRQGDVAAQGAAAQGSIRARALEQQGAAVAGGLQSIGQTAAAVPGQIEAAKTHALQQRGLALQVGAEQQSADDLKAIDRAYVQEGGRDAVIQSLPGHLRGRVLAEFTASDKAHAEANKLREEADRLQTESFADMGATIRDHEYAPAALQLALSDQKVKYAGDPGRLSQIAQIEAQLHDNPTPETVKAIVDPLINLSPKRREEAQKAAELSQKTAYENVLTTERGRHDRALEAAKTLTEGREAAEAAERIRHNKAVESIERGNAATAAAREGREQKVYEQTYGGAAKNADGTDKAPVVSPTAKLIAEYKLPPISPRAAASGPGKALMDQVAAYNPSYDGTQFATRNAMRRAFTSGNQGQQIGALNTAIEHLGLLNDFAAALDTGSFTPGNAVYNRVRDIFGSSAVNNFEFARDVMSGELATAMKKSGATDTEISKVTERLGASRSTATLQDAIRSVALPMIGGKAKTLEEQFKQTMGDKDPFSVYTPGAKQVLDTLGRGKTPAAAAAPKEGDTKPITLPGYPAGAEQTFKNGVWIRTK